MDKSYLNEFSRFLEAKLQAGAAPSAEASAEGNSSAEVVNNLMALRMRRNKMVENNSESRFNRLMKDFKQLNTYVDIRSFIADMNVVNAAGRSSNLQHSPQKTKLELSPSNGNAN